jgi:hypothetical protein
LPQEGCIVDWALGIETDRPNSLAPESPKQHFSVVKWKMCVVGFDSWIYKLFDKWALLQFPFVATSFDGAVARETKEHQPTRVPSEQTKLDRIALKKETK